MKQLTVSIEALDSDKPPGTFSWKVELQSKAPRLTAGRIIQEIERIAEAEGCSIEKIRVEHLQENAGNSVPLAQILKDSQMMTEQSKEKSQCCFFLVKGTLIVDVVSLPDKDVPAFRE